MKHCTYLFIDLFSLLGPFMLSFDKRVAFYKHWKSLFVAIACMMLLFIPWDIWKTSVGVWGFNPDYLTGIYFYNLPLEECLFFVCIPYACMFIYECMLSYFPNAVFGRYYLSFSGLLSLSLIVLAFANLHQWYTFTAFGFAGILLIILSKVRRALFLNAFYVSYLVILIPFMLVNGILTGTWLEKPIVWYSSKAIFNIRLGTIPIEDTIYNLGMLLMVVSIYEQMKKFEKKNESL